MEKTLLLVDDEPNILSALTRLFRRDSYRILTAQSGAEGLEILNNEHVCVIISDQRMSGMIGSEFLAQAKLLRPETVRIILSGYTELQSVTEAINRGAVYKFLTKPWEDDVLRDEIRDAFRVYSLDHDSRCMADELQTTNEALSQANLKLELKVIDKTREANSNLGVLRVAQEVLDALPIGVVGVDDEGLIVSVNAEGVHMLGGHPVLGMAIDEVIPRDVIEQIRVGALVTEPIHINHRSLRIQVRALGNRSQAKGYVIALISEEQPCLI